MTRPTTPTTTGTAHAVLEEAGRGILHAASMAASSHNIQPWVVEVLKPWRWVVCADPARRLPAVDPDNREPLLSIGAFLENLSLAAGSMGFRAEFASLSVDPMAYELVEVRLYQARPNGYPVERIAQRRTLRNGFRDEPISDAHVVELLAPFRGQARFFTHDSAEGRYLRKGTLDAFRRQSWRDDAQAELAAWIRFDSSEATRERDGLTPATMEINGVAGWVLRHFFDRKKVMAPGFRERGIKGVADQVEHAGGWMVIWATDRSAPALMEAGRRFQNMLNSVREMGIAVHPMTQMIQELPWGEQIASRLSVPGVPQLVLRIGYVSSYPEPVSLRKPLADFVVQAGAARSTLRHVALGSSPCG